jgi:hypothetical protein
MNKKDPNYVYYERHHIVPRCLGGTNSKLNLAYLTAEEHWVAHLLLVKLNPGNNKLVYACQAMSMTGGNTKRTTNKLFGWIRREYSKATSERQKGCVISQEHRDKISAKLKGRPVPHQQGENNVAKRPEVAKKISMANTGRKLIFSEPKLRGKRISEGKKGKPNLPGELNPAFKGWIIATPLEGGSEIRISSKKDMDLYGFTKTSVYNCLKGRNHQHKGYKFRREPLPKKIDN